MKREKDKMQNQVNENQDLATATTESPRPARPHGSNQPDDELAEKALRAIREWQGNDEAIPDYETVNTIADELEARLTFNTVVVELMKARDTFNDFIVPLQIMRRGLMAEACTIARDSMDATLALARGDEPARLSGDNNGRGESSLPHSKLIEALLPIAKAYPDDPGTSDLDDSQPVRIHLGDVRRAWAALSQAGVDWK